MSESLVDVRIEIPAWSFRKVSSGPKGWRREFWSVLPCPFNYGTALEFASADGDGQDVIVIGRRLRRGDCVRVRPRLRVLFVDDDVTDDKWVARLDGGALGPLDLACVRLFFFLYGAFKRLRRSLRGGGGRIAVEGYRPM